MFEDMYSQKENNIETIVEAAYEIEMTKGIDVLPVIRLGFGGLLKKNIMAVRITDWDSQTLVITIWRKISNKLTSETVRLNTKLHWKSDLSAINQEFIYLSLEAIFGVIRDNYHESSRLGIVEDSYYFVDDPDVASLSSIQHYAHEIYHAGGVNILPAMQLRYAGLLNPDVVAMRVTHWGNTSLCLTVWGSTEYPRQLILDTDRGLCNFSELTEVPISRMDKFILRECIRRVIEVCEDYMDRVRYSGIFEDNYFFLQQNRKIIRL